MGLINVVVTELHLPPGKTDWFCEVHAKAAGINTVVATATGPTSGKARSRAEAKASAEVRRRLKAKAARDRKGK